jgi:small GTP-binding protein
MPDGFKYDVFMSHSAKDRPLVRPLAERLQADGLKVWFDEWVLNPGDSIPAKIEEALEHSRVLVLCMSASAMGSDWARLEAGTFRFRDPLNKERRFIPLWLDDAPIKGSLAQFPYINWLPANRDKEYGKLLEACQVSTTGFAVSSQREVRVLKVNSRECISDYAFSPDGRRALYCGGDEYTSILGLYDLAAGRSVRTFEGNSEWVHKVVWSADQRYALSIAGNCAVVRLWDVETGACVRLLRGHNHSRRRADVISLAWSADQRMALSGSQDTTVRLWDIDTGHCLHVLEGHTDDVETVAWSADQRYVLSGSKDRTLRLWDIDTGHCLHVLEGHTDDVETVAWSADRRLVVSGSKDRTLRLWDVETGRCLRVLEGHTHSISCAAWSADRRFVLSGSSDARLWDVEKGHCVAVLKGHTGWIGRVAWSVDGRRAFSGDSQGGIRLWDLSAFVTEARALEAQMPIEGHRKRLVGISNGIDSTQWSPTQVQYTNAKVLLVGESGVGKTGLSKRLASDIWEPSDSTVGAWATQWKLPVASGEGVEREIWLWDFGGQADQRLIHQLYMDETALAVLVFDGQKEDLFETLGQWDRDLTRASRNPFAKLLVAGRVDAGGLRAGRSEVEKFAAERKFRGFLETSAKQNLGCEELKQAILAAINWDELPCRTTEVLFKRLKEEIIRLKDEGRVLMRFNELRETLQLRLVGQASRLSDPMEKEAGGTLAPQYRFTDEELRAVLTLLAGPGVVWELEFGSWVLLQPERINAYAQAVIRTLQSDEHQRGCLTEERVLKGDLAYESSMPRLVGDEERFVLLAMHQTLVERGLCLRQPTARGNLLIFPSFYRGERPEQIGHPAVLVSYHFSGFLDEIYATLVTWLHHTEPFQQDRLWRYAADFKTNTGKQLGVKLTRRAPSVGELEVYFEPSVSIEEKIIFSKYVHEHLLRHARDVERLRHYVCPHCGTAVGNREVAMQRLNDWLRIRPIDPDNGGYFRFRETWHEPPSIICVGCERRVPLWDEMELCFASADIQQRVRDLLEESAIELSNQSKERALVGEVISTVALADQISREFNVSDQGIDMEIEFNDDVHEATGRKLYLQLKSGDSYLRERKSDGAEIFTIKDERHARYWMTQAFPVLLVIRNSEGEVRWMEVRDWLKRATDDGKKPVKQIVFAGERFDVMSVRRWREKLLAA